MAYLMLGIVMIFLSIVFRLAAVFRLTIPLLYALIVPTVFHEWYHSNQQLGDLIGYLLLAAVALSWVISLVRKIRGILLRRREDKMLELRASSTLSAAKTDVGRMPSSRIQAKNRDNSFFIAPPSKWAERGVEQYVAHHLFLNMI